MAPTVDDEAKRLWLARLDAPWGRAAAVVAELAEEALVIEKMTEDKMTEEDAKKAWLARLDAPTWGAVAAAVAAVSTESVQGPAEKMTEDDAKKAWLARLDAPTWGKAAKMITEVVQEASDVQQMPEACDAIGKDTCELSLSREEKAKKDWLARLDVTSWGAAAAAVSAIATSVGA